MDDIDLALSDEELLMPAKSPAKSSETKSVASTPAPEGVATPLNGETDSNSGIKTPVAASPIKKDKNQKTAADESPSVNKHNFFYVVSLICNKIPPI